MLRWLTAKHQTSFFCASTCPAANPIQDTQLGSRLHGDFMHCSQLILVDSTLSTDDRRRRTGLRLTFGSVRWWAVSIPYWFAIVGKFGPGKEAAAIASARLSSDLAHPHVSSPGCSLLLHRL